MDSLTRRQFVLASGLLLAGSAKAIASPEPMIRYMPLQEWLVGEWRIFVSIGYRPKPPFDYSAKISMSFHKDGRVSNRNLQRKENIEWPLWWGWQVEECPDGKNLLLRADLLHSKGLEIIDVRRDLGTLTIVLPGTIFAPSSDGTHPDRYMVLGNKKAIV